MSAGLAAAMIGVLASAADAMSTSEIHERLHEQKSRDITPGQVRAGLIDLQRRGLIIRTQDDRYRLRAAAAHVAVTSDVLLDNDVPAGVPVPEVPEVES
ncbi:MAG: hypothetical protein E6R06_10500 [Mycobacterium sp.]|nr:MAG: hypothetical protein E6R06_10500 [Mycobacterium sp.]